MALENLTPVTRMESILNGDDVAPVTREEYFWKQAASGGESLPSYTADDAGKVLTVALPVIVPEQSIAFAAGYGEANGVDFSSLNIGDEVTFTGTAMGQTLELSGEVVADGDDKKIVFEDSYLKSNGDIYISLLASVPSVTVAVDTIYGDAAKAEWGVKNGLPDWSNAAEGATLTIVNGEPIWYFKVE